MEDWNASKFDKNSRPTAVKKLQFSRTDDENTVLHHNVHLDSRVGGHEKEQLTWMDNDLKKALDNYKDGDIIVVRNVTYGWWRFPGASSKRDWIFPTDKTNVTVIPGNRTKNEGKISMIDKILIEGLQK